MYSVPSLVKLLTTAYTELRKQNPIIGEIVGSAEMMPILSYAMAVGLNLIISVVLAEVLCRTHRMTVVGVVNLNFPVHIVKSNLHSAAAQLAS